MKNLLHILGISRKIVFSIFLFSVSLTISTTVTAKLSHSKIAELNEIQDLKAIEDTSKPLLRLPNEAKWTKAPEPLPAGAEMFVLEGNPTRPAPYIIRLKLPANYRLPAHWNLNDEHITVISGTLNMGVGDKLEEASSKLLPTGSYARIPARMNYFAWTGEEETIIQLNAMGPWGLTYVENPEGQNLETPYQEAPQ